MRAKMLGLLILLAVFTAGCRQAAPPGYANSPEGAARRLLDAWQAYDPDLYLDAVLLSERQYVSVFSTNEFAQSLASSTGNKELPERPRLKFRDLRFETAVGDNGRATVTVAGYWRELNLAMEAPFSATIVAQQEDGVWLCAVSETTTNILLLNPATTLQTLAETASRKVGDVLSARRSPDEASAASADRAATTDELPVEMFRDRARDAFRHATAFRVDIIDYTGGKETRSVFWQRDRDWRWRLPNGEFRATAERMCWQPLGAASWECSEKAWPGRFRALPLLALASEEFSANEPGEWTTYSPHTVRSEVQTIDGVACRVFAMQSARDREECCFDLATYRPIQCSYTLDGDTTTASYRDWNVIVDWDFPPQ